MPEKPPLCLDKLTTRNFKGLGPEFSIDFSEQLTVLVGANSVGKTSVLEAAAVPGQVWLALADSQYAYSRLQGLWGTRDAEFPPAVGPSGPEVSFESVQGKDVVKASWTFPRPIVSEWRIERSGTSGAALNSTSGWNADVAGRLRPELARFSSLRFSFERVNRPGITGGSICWKDGAMGRMSKYPAELKERAVRLVVEHRGEHESEWAAIQSIAAKVGCPGETLRVWLRQSERDAGQRDGLTTGERERFKEMEREIRELKRANEILRKASAYFAQAELDRRPK